MVALTECKARETRPDGAFWRDGRWMVAKTVGRSWHAGTQILPADPVPWWPESIDDVEASSLGRADNHVAEGVWANEPSEEPRK